MPVRMTPTAFWPGIAGGGAEQHIDRRAMAADQRTVLDLDVIARAAALEQQVMIARRDQRAPANHRVVGLGLFDGDGAKAVEAVGEGAREQLRHVLHDDDAGSVGRERFEHGLQRFRSAGGGADDDNLLSGFDHGMGRGRENGVGGELGFDGMAGREARSRAEAAAFTDSQMVLRESSRNCLVPSLGLVMMSTAPYSSALQGALRALFGEARSRSPPEWDAGS